MNVLVVSKKSVFELYGNSRNRKTRDYVRQQTPEAERIRKSHDEQKRTIDTVLETLEKSGVKHEEVHRAQLQAKDYISGRDLIVSVGGDGTFLEVSHYVTDVPLLGVNSDTGASVGYFCTATRHSFEGMIGAIGKEATTKLNRLELRLDGKRIPELILNDILVAHANPAAMTRYRIVTDGMETHHRSSGLLVCTAAGSTAWMYNEGGEAMPLCSEEMQYLNRGVRGEKPKFANMLAIISETREGKMYIDGDHLQYEFTLGSRIELGKGTPLVVIGNFETKRARYQTAAM